VTGRSILPAAALWLVFIGQSASGQVVPAELPPEGYAGQQYVDSKGCLFLRAGPKGNETWIPRVTRDGALLCDNPPSGRRVPIADEDTAENPEAKP
jgi:hypothetical protein